METPRYRKGKVPLRQWIKMANNDENKRSDPDVELFHLQQVLSRSEALPLVPTWVFLLYRDQYGAVVIALTL